MVDRNLVGRCGLYCGACIVYRAQRDSAKLRESIAKDYNRSPQEVRCDGCQKVVLSGWDMDSQWGKNCLIVKCLNEKRLNTCYQCDAYPECERFRQIRDSCLKDGENLMENLKMINSGKVEKWLEEEDRKWRCPKCGKPTTMHLYTCHWCGAALQKK